MKIYISSYVFWSTTIGALVVSTNNAAHALENEGEYTMDPETGTCQAETKPKIPDQAALVDDLQNCVAWAEGGECDVNINFMRRQCKASCAKIDERIGNQWFRPKPYPRLVDSPTCQLYMAESSIPHSGLGMYTATAIAKDHPIYHPDIVVNYFDFSLSNQIAEELKTEEGRAVDGKLKNTNTKCSEWARVGECDANPNYMLTDCAKACALFKAGLLDKVDKELWLPDDYYWNPGNTDSLYEADEVSSLVPGLGALANSHTGLVNAGMLRPRHDSTAMHRSVDPGVGAFSNIYNLGYKAENDIPAGMELFVEYGDEWFSGREHKFGPLPLRRHFEEADEMMESFWKTANEEDPFAEDLFNLTKALITDVKLSMALPDSFKKAREGKNDKVALLSVPNAIRSQEWLETNGICLDNIRAGQSNVRQAGRGASATRDLQRGEIIAPLPLIHMDREKVRTFGDDDIEGPEQLIVNYSYSHKESSLILFPYSPVVNFVNNNADKSKVNARIRWSTSKYHTKEWENLTVKELLGNKRAGLMLEMVATKDIEFGEEIFLDYGSEWDSAWEDYVEKWESPKPGYRPIHTLNVIEVLKTETELMKTHTYSENAMTICFMDNSINNRRDLKGAQWQSYRARFDQVINSRPCDVVERIAKLEKETGKDVFYYNARIENKEGASLIVEGMPRDAIEIVNKSYTSDQHLPNGFRHPIHIPDEIFPIKWKNLGSEIIDDGQTFVHGSVKDSWESKEGAFEQCRFWLAESSIEGAGMGMYAGDNLKPGDFTKKEIIIPVYDYGAQTKLRCEMDPIFCKQNSDWLLYNYEWHPSAGWSNFDAAENYFAIPGMGSIPNHHIALASSQPQVPKKAGGGLHRSKDPAAGAITLFEDHQSQITRNIQAGQEIFISYGPDYFDEKPEYQNITKHDDFLLADSIVKSFMRRVEEQRIEVDGLQDLWAFERSEFIQSKTILELLPADVRELKRLSNMGTASYHLPESRRSTDWLLENGRCLDLIEIQKSTIPGAGRGAFARRMINKDEVVSSSPVLQHNREFMGLYMRRGKSEDDPIEEVTKQLILNYMFGHKDSNLLLWPIAPAVNAVNHKSGEGANVKIRWSTLPFHKKEWLNQTGKEVLSIFKSGLIIDYVATRDIEVGEEVFIDYGPDFDAAWTNYIANWKPVSGAEDYKSSWQITSAEKKIRTRKEEPYADNIVVHCSVPQHGWRENAAMVDTWYGAALVWENNDPDMYFQAFEHAQPCDIFERRWDEEADDWLYTAQVHAPEDDPFFMTEIQFVYLVDVKYTIDDFLENAFRHEIGLPDGMYPDTWMDIID